jgi:hypothetical protein
MRRFLALALLASCAVATAQAQSGPPGDRLTMSCFFNLGYYAQGYPIPARKQVDPIVSPGIQVSAHMHDFYGNQDISDYMFAHPIWPLVPGFDREDATHHFDPGYAPQSTSCRNYGDWAGYWYPTPKFNGAFTLSSDLQETWQSPAGVYVATPPFGMAFVAGNSMATSPAQESSRVRFTCGDLDGPGSPSPMDCTSGGTVTAELTFPDCWDGYNTLPFGGHTPAGIAPSHFTYSTGGACASGSQPLAQLVTRQHFIDPRTNAVMVNPFNADGSLALSFASGPYYTYHGDYLDLWNIGLFYYVETCLNHRPVPATGGNGFIFGGVCPVVQ